MQTSAWQANPTDRAGSVSIHTHPRGLLARVKGPLTRVNSASLRIETLAAWSKAGEVPRVVIDLAEAGQIDSSGAGALVALSQKAKEAGVPLILSGLQEGPRRILVRTGLGTLFRTSDSVEDALLGISRAGVDPEARAAVAAKEPPPAAQKRPGDGRGERE